MGTVDTGPISSPAFLHLLTQTPGRGPSCLPASPGGDTDKGQGSHHAGLAPWGRAVGSGPGHGSVSSAPEGARCGAGGGHPQPPSASLCRNQQNQGWGRGLCRRPGRGTDQEPRKDDWRPLSTHNVPEAAGRRLELRDLARPERLTGVGSGHLSRPPPPAGRWEVESGPGPQVAGAGGIAPALAAEWAAHVGVRAGDRGRPAAFSHGAGSGAAVAPAPPPGPAGATAARWR